jgi:hypothetical protein
MISVGTKENSPCLLWRSHGNKHKYSPIYLFARRKCMHNSRFIHRILLSTLIAVLTLSGITSSPMVIARATPIGPDRLHPPALSTHIEAPDDVTFTPLDRERRQSIVPTATSSALNAVAIVGDVNANTKSYKDDMDTAAQALEDHGVTVHKFYHGESTFTWADIVAAAEGAELILYMGHGVYSGSMPYPDIVGGFWLRDGHFVSPDQIRTDLDGWLAEDSAIIFSHACFTAGSSSADPRDLPLSEAQRRVQMYAAPFVDLGMRTYFANNNFGSAANFVNQLLADLEERQTNGVIFKSTPPYSESDFHDMSYPQVDYDLWLSGDVGKWNDAFVGVPTHIFLEDSQPTLGHLPASLAFTYNKADQSPTPTQHILTPENVSTNDPLTWKATTDVNWLRVTPITGTTPQALSVLPQDLGELADGSYSGTLTLTVTTPPDTQNGQQTIPVTLDVETPELGGLPTAITFTYSITDQVWIPTRHTLRPRNITTDDPITWQAESSGPLTLDRTEGTTPQGIAVTPADFGSMTITIIGPLADGVITVTATSPTQTLYATQTIDVAFVGRAVALHQAFLPLIMK